MRTSSLTEPKSQKAVSQKATAVSSALGLHSNGPPELLNVHTDRQQCRCMGDVPAADHVIVFYIDISSPLWLCHKLHGSVLLKI